MVVKKLSQNRGYSKALFSVCITIIVIVLCSSFAFAAEQKAASSLTRYRVFSFKHISPEQGMKYLTEFKIGAVSKLPGANTILVTAQPLDLVKASAILKLVDAEEQFVIEAICSAAEAGSLPTNDKIAKEVGNISIGTFNSPPATAKATKAIIDKHNDAVILIAPASRLDAIFSAIDRLQKKQTPASAEPNKTVEPNQLTAAKADVNAPEPDKLFNNLLDLLDESKKTAVEKAGQQPSPAKEPNIAATAAEKEAAGKPTVEPIREPSPLPAETPETKKAAEESALKPQGKSVLEQAPAETKAGEAGGQASVRRSYTPEAVALGNEMLELDFPEKLSIMELIDFVGKNLKLDYLYDPKKVAGEITLKLQGPIKVRDLYPLLESVLKFNGFVMSRKVNLVTIVPVTEALNIDPTLLGAEKGKVELGDVVVTRIFNLQYIDPASAQNLLVAMKLGGAKGENITPIPETSTLIITEYAQRMSRIEELLEMIDKPGEPKQFKFRQLKYTMAITLAPKVKDLVEQLGDISITVAKSAEPTLRRGRRPRTPPTPPQQPTPTPAAETGKPSVYLDADERTNRILMIGVEAQLAVVEELIEALDVEQQDLRTLRLYDIQNVGAEEVKNKLEELGIIGGGKTAPDRSRLTRLRETPAAAPGGAPRPETATGEIKEPLVEEPQVVIIEATNSLLVNATAEQHVRIASIIGYVDSETLERAIPYEIYSLENQKPEDLAGVLQKLIQETIKDKESKVEKVVKREEDIVIVPDKNTFSIIVYASRKNQEWIKSLIKQLDKRRPQVLIDVTLVEVSRTDLFDMDLQLASKFPELAPGGTMDKVGAVKTPFLSKTSIEAYSSPVTGLAQGFYSDRHIQALLTAMQTKSYGRVLAKPKILVNDGQAGTIQTKDTTNVAIENLVPGTNNQNAFSTKTYTPYSAGITLTITPNISEGDLLLLQTKLTRSDFGTGGPAGGPPNTNESDIDTTVTVPNGRTIILGGMIKLNQSKGGTKVPLLGDIPLVGGLFRSTSNTARDSKLYIFVKANILRPEETIAGLPELERISDRNRTAFEEFEGKFQNQADWPGIKPAPMDPLKVLEAE